MAGPIYKLWMFRPKEAWYQLSKEERDNHANKIMEDIEKVGGKSVLICTPTCSRTLSGMRFQKRFSWEGLTSSPTGPSSSYR